MTTDSNTNAAEKPMSIRECLDAVHKAGGNAWDKVADPDGFIRWMRGSDDPKDVAAADQAMQSMPAQSPASAPEQASAGAATVEAISALVHERWMEAKRKGGVASRRSESGEELMVPYNQLSEPAKELDRASVRAVLSAQGALSPRPSGVREQQDKSWQCPKCKRWQMHAWDRCRSEFDTGIPCDGVREQPSYIAAGAMTPDQLREWKQQQAEQGDGKIEKFARLYMDQKAVELENEIRRIVIDSELYHVSKDDIYAEELVRAVVSKCLAALAQPPRQSGDGRMRSMPAVSTTIPPDEARRNREAAASVAPPTGADGEGEGRG
jgi:hypothetical protein